MVNYRTFETLENQKKNGQSSWKKLRQLSDAICRENGLSTIKNPHKKTCSHYEWEQGQKSWKSLLRQAIDGAVYEAENFDDLLDLLQKANIETTYNSNLKVSLKFRYPEQKRWARAATLGEQYTPEKLAERIERYRRWIKRGIKS